MDKGKKKKQKKILWSIVFLFNFVSDVAEETKVDFYYMLEHSSPSDKSFFHKETNKDDREIIKEILEEGSRWFLIKRQNEFNFLRFKQ